MAEVTRSTIAKVAAAADKPNKPYEIRSERVHGLLLRVQPSGKRTFYCQIARGKRVKVGSTSHLTLKQAEERAKAIMRDPEAALQARKAPAGTTLRDLVDGDYKTFATAHKKDAEATLKRIRAAWAPLLDRRVDEITATDVEALRTKRLVAGRAPSTINRDVAALSSVLTYWAKQSKTENPLRGDGFDKVEEPDDKRVRYLTKDEAARLRQALADRDDAARAERERYNAWRRQRGLPQLPAIGRFADHVSPMVLITLNTGLRQGELFALTWEAVNLDLRQITVKAATAKSNKTRVIPLNDEALDVFNAIKPTIAAGLVFKSPKTGGMFTDTKKAWANLCEAAKLVDFRWHDMRHDFASQLVVRGVSLYAVQALLGHGSSVMTQRYAHLRPGHLADAVAMLGGAK
ncbi:site-specific integrase [Azohydromonas sp.]|uniref:site-specific integrase n=1 Tax=Azohydromonas sp. TaxID=1872666 RepID=UPI002BD455BA|nr:site-specific integrase [Azohydromonas sp.]HMM85335.1 site-specific integrase [Azohydromonas sp.]